VRARALAAVLALCAACAPTTLELPSPELPGRPVQGRSRFHRFKVRTSAVPAEIRRGLSREEVSRLPGAAGSGLQTQGLTTIKHSLATHTRFSTAKGTKAVYAWFDDVILEVSVSSDIIHIPREYPPGSCEYQAVLEHERGHGRVAREMAMALAGRLERALMASDRIPTRFDPVISPDFAMAAEHLKEDVAKIVDPIYDRFEAEHKAAQEKLDRPDPYDAVYRKCSGWR
jgi:hypothetical protein